LLISARNVAFLGKIPKTRFQEEIFAAPYLQLVSKIFRLRPVFRQLINSWNFAIFRFDSRIPGAGLEAKGSLLLLPLGQLFLQIPDFVFEFLGHFHRLGYLDFGLDAER